MIKNSRTISKKPIQNNSVFVPSDKLKNVKFEKSEAEEDTVTEIDDDATEATEDIVEEEGEDVEEGEEEGDEEDGDEEGPADDEPVDVTTDKEPEKDGCVYNEVEDEIFVDDDIIEIEEAREIVVEPENRITKPRLTLYERVRILGLRAKQISLGAKVMLRNVENKTPLEIAELELKHNMLPYKIKRPLANNLVEIWKLSELQK